MSAEVTYREIFRRFMAGESMLRLARELKLPLSAIEQIVRDRGR